MAGAIGFWVMALIQCYLAAILIEWAVIARLLDTPAVGIALSSLLGTGLVILLQGWFQSPHGSFILPVGAPLYLLAGAIIAIGRILLRWRSDLAAEQVDEA